MEDDKGGGDGGSIRMMRTAAGEHQDGEGGYGSSGNVSVVDGSGREEGLFF